MDIDKITEYVTSEATREEATRHLNALRALTQPERDIQAIECDAIWRNAEHVAAKYGHSARDMKLEHLAELIVFDELEREDKRNE